MINHQPPTPRRLHPHPAPLTLGAKTRRVAIFTARGVVSYTHGCRVQHLPNRCTCVALNVAVNIQQKQGLKAQVQQCNAITGFTHMRVRTRIRAHASARAHTRHIYRCTVAPLHLYYNILILLNISLQHRCNTLVFLAAKPLHLATTRMCNSLALAYLNVVKPLFLNDNLAKTFVYRGFIE